MDPRNTAGCTPTDAQTYDFKKPSAKDGAKPHKDPKRARQSPSPRPESRCVDPHRDGEFVHPTGRFVVRLKKNGTVKGKGKIVLKVTDSTPKTDTDALKFTCLPNPAIATSVCASARQITSASELIGGPLALGKVGDYLMENDKARFIIRDTGREFSFPAHLRRSSHRRGLPAEARSGNAQPTVSGGSRCLSRDDAADQHLFDRQSADDHDRQRRYDERWPRRTAHDGSGRSLRSRRWTRRDQAVLDVVVGSTVRDRQRHPGHGLERLHVELRRQLLANRDDGHNTGGSALDLYVGDFANGSGESVGPVSASVIAAIRLGAAELSRPKPISYDWFGWWGAASPTSSPTG